MKAFIVRPFGEKNGINFNDVPAWQRRGVGLWWESYDRAGAQRRRIHVERELPIKDDFRALLVSAGGVG